ncbi:MAG: SCO family protein [Verrucomicrobia bacterium]|nr:SCO family protein [Verrucomicrobiota bacterium]
MKLPSFPFFPFPVLVSLSLPLLAACTRTDPKASPSTPPPSPATASAPSPAPTAPAAPTSYPIRGEIVGFDLPRQVLVIHHEEIPGYMPAMTMEFTAPGIDLTKLREGQRLAARMGAPLDGVFPLTEFRLLDPAQDQAVAAAALALRQDTFTRGKNVYREVGEPAPSFTLYNQDGKAVSFATFRGQRVVLNFIFTRCPVATMCPASTAKMMALQAAAKKAGVKNLELVSISFDSAYDTPPVLKQYATERGIDTTNFSFLTGPENAIRDLLAQFGVIAQPGENVFKHTLSTLLIGPDGKILHRVDGSTWTPDDFLPRL